MQESSIQWTDVTWNCIRGCSRVSTGCENCYAEGVAARFSGTAVRDGRIVRLPYYGLARHAKNGESRWTGDVRFVTEHLLDPFRRKKPSRIFVNSMSDLFHEKVSNEQIAAIFGVMAVTPRHTFQVLTKRARRMREWFEWAVNGPVIDGARIGHVAQIRCSRAAVGIGISPNVAGYDTVNGTSRHPWPLPNVHLGVSCETQETANERIPHLLSSPAAVRWVSAEPLISPINFNAIDATKAGWRSVNGFPEPTAISAFGKWQEAPMRARLQNGIDWVVVGGESGGGARPFDIQWARDIVAHCRAVGVPVFVKQLGAVVHHDGIVGMGRSPWPRETGSMDVGGKFRKHLVDSKHGGDMSEWPEDLRVRQWPT